MEKKVFVIISNSYMGDILLVNSLVQNIKNLYQKTDSYIALCAISSKKEKDLPLDTIFGIIERMDKKKIIFLGCGKQAEKIGDEIEKRNYANFINLYGLTDIAGI